MHAAVALLVELRERRRASETEGKEMEDEAGRGKEKKAAKAGRWQTQAVAVGEDC